MTRSSPLVPLALAALLAPATSRAVPYSVRLPPAGLEVQVRYTGGVHREHMTRVAGTVGLRDQDLALEGGELTFPLDAFARDNATRACHLREAMGLDYARSRFPREHVCDHDQLPASGPDAIAYPEIVLALGTAPDAPAGGALAIHQSREVEIPATLTLHGVTRPLTLRLTVARVGERTLHVHGDVPVRLSDFGVQVKSAKVLFLTISVEDQVKIGVDVLLERAGR